MPDSMYNPPPEKKVLLVKMQLVMTIILLVSVRDNIYAHFRISPILLGIQNETKGFAKSEYLEAFELFNNTIVKSYQTEIIKSLKNIGVDLIIDPFYMEEK